MNAFKSAYQRLRRYFFELLLLLLFAVTVVAMLSFEHLSKETLTIEAGGKVSTTLTDDGINNGGSSFSEWIDEEQQIWRCDLVADYLYYYCLLTYNISADYRKDAGINLNRYDEVTVYYDYQSGHDDTLRIQLRNFNPEFSSVDDTLSLKFNEFEFRPSEYGNQITIDLNKFYVANWWLVERKIPAHLSDPNFDNITTIEVQTGSKDHVGQKIIQIKKFVFTGKTIAAESFYLGIIVIWLVCLSALGTIRLSQIIRDLREERRHRESLTQQNAQLKLKKLDLEQRVHIDKLTSVFNRSGIEQALYILHKQWQNQSAKYGLIVIDLDHFKDVNDLHGHQVGDQVLAIMGTVLQSCVRSEDAVGRWGGEEFVVLAELETIEQLKGLAEKTRLAIETAEWPLSLNITASLGAAIVTQKDSTDSLFSRADSLLYKAKNSGRNQVKG